MKSPIKNQTHVLTLFLASTSAVRASLICAAALLTSVSISQARPLESHYDNKSRSEITSVVADGTDIIGNDVIEPNSKRYGKSYTSSCAPDAEVIFNFGNGATQKLELDTCKAYSFTISDNMDRDASTKLNNRYVIVYKERN